MDAGAAEQRTDIFRRTIVAFVRRDGPDAEAGLVRPLVGRRRRFISVAQALERSDLEPSIVLTDITATAWPTD
jgi:hypothetical protein